MALVDKKAFLGPSTSVDLGEPDSILLLSTFDKSRFDIELYEKFQVGRPETLSKAVEKRQAEHLAGRALVQQAFAQLGEQAMQILIGPDRAPVWPDGVQGSISHSKGQVACLVTTRPQQYVGIDIEGDLTENALKSVKQVTLQPSELGLLAQQTNLTEAQLACAIFSAKETLFKALYPIVQRFFGFEAAACIAVNDTSLQIELTQDLHPTLLSGHKFDVQIQPRDGFVLAWLMHQA